MRLFVVRLDPDSPWMGNAETPEEAVAYAVARTNKLFDVYIVYDWDANRFVVPGITPAS